MKSKTCWFDGQEYIVWLGSDLDQRISMIPEKYGVFPDYGRGTDAYRAIGYVLVVEGNELFLNDIEVTAIGDCYFPIGGIAPLILPGNPYGATYGNLCMKIEKTGSLTLLKNQLKDRGCVSGWFDPSDFGVVLELEFIGGKLLRETEGFSSAVDDRNFLAHSYLQGIDRSKWSALEAWMRDCLVIERAPEEEKRYWSAVKAGEDILNCMAKFPGVRKQLWSNREMSQLGAAAQGKIVQQEAFELLCLFEKMAEMHDKEDEEWALDELLIRGRKFWEDVNAWMTTEIERWPKCLLDIVRRLAGADIESDVGMSKQLLALVRQYEARKN